MLLLADVPDAVKALARHFSESDVCWRVLNEKNTQDSTRIICKKLTEGAGVSQLTTTCELPYWTHLVLIEQASQSQFDQLRTLFSQPGANYEPTACVALTGRNFHGHRGRAWSAAPGNLHLSVAFRPDLPVAEFGLAMTMLPAVAVIDAMSATGGGAIPAGIKWVNDILIEGRKVAGVLTATQSQHDRISMVVLGIGLNIAIAPPITPTVFVPQAGCLQAVAGCQDLSLPVLLEALLVAIARRVAEFHKQGAQPLIEAYREASLVIGRRIRVWEEGISETAAASDLPPPLAIGTVTEITADLGLTLSESTVPISRGRLAFDDVCRRLGI